MKIDLPADAPSQQIKAIAASLGSLLDALDGTKILHLNFAFSAAALVALDGERFGPLLGRVRSFASMRRIELLGTAAHGALLPLLPEDELERQLQLNDDVNRRYFGDAYNGVCLWPPALAFSHKVARVAARLGFSSLLVDDASMRVWPGKWRADRIDAIEGMAGMFLLPSSRDGSRAFDEGRIDSLAGMNAFIPDPHRPAYLITAVDLTPESRVHESLQFHIGEARTTRLEKLFCIFPTSGTTSPLDCSRLSAADELSSGLPFATWYRPGDAEQGMRWRLMSRLVEVFRTLEKKGLTAQPATKVLRDAIDRGWRERWWRTAEDGLGPIGRALETVRLVLNDTQTREAVDAVRDLGGAVT